MVIRWHGAPRLTRFVVAAVVLVLGYGTVIHLVSLVGNGVNQYLDLPGWLRTYFLLLTILDPLAMILLACRTRAGVALAVMVLVSDAMANGWANYALDSAGGVTAGRVGQGVTTTLAVAVCVASPYLWRAASGHGRDR